MKKNILLFVLSLFLFQACGSEDNANDQKAEGSPPTDSSSSPDVKVQESDTKNFVGFADEKEGKYGFTDGSGNVLIDYRFDCAASFREGYARVGQGECSFGRLTSGKYGFIDTRGNLVVDYVWDDARNFHLGMAAVATGEYDSYGLLQDEKWGYIDVEGKQVIPLQFDGAKDFSEGLAAVRKGKLYKGKFGYINKSGEMVIDYQYDLADDFKGRYAAAGVHNKVGIIDKGGRPVIPFEYDNYKTIVVLFGEGSNSYFTENSYAVLEKKGKWDFVNKRNEGLTGFIYDDLGLFSEGMAAVKKGELWGYINEAGKEVIPPRFFYAGQFNGGTASVKTSAEKDAPMSDINYRGVIVTDDH